MIVRWQNHIPREIAALPLFKVFKTRLVKPLAFIKAGTERYNGSFPFLILG